MVERVKITQHIQVMTLDNVSNVPIHYCIGRTLCNISIKIIYGAKISEMKKYGYN